MGSMRLITGKCKNCGVFSDSLRRVYHRGKSQGRWCRACRKGKAIRYSRSYKPHKPKSVPGPWRLEYIKDDD